MTRSSGKFMKLLLCMLCMLCVAVAFSAEPAFASSENAFQKTKVTGVTAEGVGPHTIQLEWNQVPGAKGYTVYASKWKFGRYYRIQNIARGTTTSTQIQGCETGKTYYFKVRAFAGSASTTLYSKNSKSVKGKAAPSAPKITLKLRGKTEILVTISRVSGANGYVLYRATKKNGHYAKIATINAAATGKTVYADTGKKGTNYNNSGLKGKTTYYYKVKAYSKSGSTKKYGKFSSVKNLKTKARPNGNADKYSVAKVAYEPDPQLAGKRIYFLGSSITLGYRAINGIEAFADIMTKRHSLQKKADGTPFKYAITGTTMVGNTNDSADKDLSYVYRIGEIKKETGAEPAPDYLICQLSSNDASRGAQIGELLPNDVKDSNSFVTTSGQVKQVTTVANAIEYITAYAKETWNCPVIFYVIPEYPDVYQKWAYADKYQQMIEVLYQAQKKWGEDQLKILNLRQGAYKVTYSNADDQFLCMYDPIHPKSAGYLLKYTPMFEKYLKALYAQQAQQLDDPQQLMEMQQLTDDPTEEVPDGLTDQAEETPEDEVTDIEMVNVQSSEGLQIAE